jgi:hypothetical protein
VTVGTQVAAQQQTIIRESCGEPWRIETTHLFRIGGPADPDRLEGSLLMARDSRGRFIAYRNGRSQVFDSTGKYLQSFGNLGEGPGEYRLIRKLQVTAGDTIRFLDTRNARITVLSPEFEVIETMPLAVGAFNEGVRLPSGMWIIDAAIRTEDRVGFPLHALADDGTISRSFGALTPVFRADAPGLNRRHPAAAGEDRVWAAHDQQYLVELWDTAGNLLRSLKRDVEWFRPWIRHEQIHPEVPWKPRLTSIDLDSAGILWARVMIAKPNWSDYIHEYTPGRYTIREPVHQAFYVVLEALDVNRGCVLARLETDHFMGGRLSGGYITAYNETPRGIPYLDVWRLRLVRDPDQEEAR